VVDGDKPGVDSSGEGKHTGRNNVLFVEKWKERSVIRREDDVDGRANVTKDEERVL